ncbi:hypothetical protein [Clavibacter michiganensis]|uniref:hypothetical protein n=1 Tax=Clavibacter michiganensis TaxID=28447 RepID=UPI001FF0CA6E|nr:hypothetical protein [Clavibacter michiganensis]
MLADLALPVPLAARVDGVVLRRATAADLAPLMGLLADDPVSAARGDRADPDDADLYGGALARVLADAANDLLVATDADGTVVGTLQLTLIPGMARRGSSRLQVEAVRVRSDLRSAGIGGATMSDRRGDLTAPAAAARDSEGLRQLDPPHHGPVDARRGRRTRCSSGPSLLGLSGARASPERSGLRRLGLAHLQQPKSCSEDDGGDDDAREPHARFIREQSHREEEHRCGTSCPAHAPAGGSVIHVAGGPIRPTGRMDALSPRRARGSAARRPGRAP